MTAAIVQMSQPRAVISNANRDNFSAKMASASAQFKFVMETISVVTILMKHRIAISLCALISSSSAMKQLTQRHSV